MKNKIALASAFLAASSFSTAEIVINEFLSFEGFVDMSYTNTDQEVGGAQSNSNSYGLDQVEIAWLFDFDPVTAQIDLTHLGSDNPNAAISGVEQAFATYHMEGGAAITAGRFASMLGFEAFEPTGLYQYSLAYNDSEDLASAFGPPAVNLVSGGILPRYDQGVKYTYETDTAFFGASIVDSVDVGRLGGGTGPANAGGSYGVELAGALDLGNGFSVFGGARYDDGDGSGLIGFDNATTLNGYATYETGAWVFGAELAYRETELPGAAADVEVTQGLLMANFAYSDAASVTGRISFVDADAGAGAGQDFAKYTVAHGYAFTDNLFLVNEISMVDGDNAGVDVEELHAAVELIFSF